MAVEHDTEKEKSSSNKKVSVSYISDDESAAQRRNAAIKSSQEYQREVAKQRSNRLLTQDLLDRYQKKVNRPLTVKEAMLIKGVVAGKTKRQAAKDAGYAGSDTVVSVTASQVLNKPNVKAAMQAALEQAGVTVEGVAVIIADGMKAERTVISGVGDNAIIEKTPDHNVRIAAGKMAAKYLGVEDKDDDGSKGTNIFNFFNNNNFNSKSYVSDDASDREIIDLDESDMVTSKEPES